MKNKRQPHSEKNTAKQNSKKKNHKFKKRTIEHSTRFKKNNHRKKRTAKINTFDPTIFINKDPIKTEETIYTPENTFETFGLDDRIAKIIKVAGYKVPSPIQDKIIPYIIDGKDVIGLAETGTGKTAAFLLPLINKTLLNKHNLTIIITPTRELAIQINDELKKFSTGLNIYSTICVGGMNIGPQIKSLHRHNHFIIGTPGRMLDLQKKGHLKTNRATTVVLDEADRMLDMGFITDIRSIINMTNDSRQTLFFSATMTKEAKKVVNDFLKKPEQISVKKNDTVSSIRQDIVKYTKSDKFNILKKILSDKNFNKVIIFVGMKYTASRLANQLTEAGLNSESIHGNKTHFQRQQALTKFKNNKVHILVATDVAARGIHVDNVSHVINYDLPQQFDDYIHRIGRTGRASKKGEALTFIQK